MGPVQAHGGHWGCLIGEGRTANPMEGLSTFLFMVHSRAWETLSKDCSHLKEQCVNSWSIRIGNPYGRTIFIYGSTAKCKFLFQRNLLRGLQSRSCMGTPVGLSGTFCTARFVPSLQTAQKSRVQKVWREKFSSHTPENLSPWRIVDNNIPVILCIFQPAEKIFNLIGIQDEMKNKKKA